MNKLCVAALLALSLTWLRAADFRNETESSWRGDENH